MSDPLQAVMEERARQDTKWGANRDLHDTLWLAILMEEVGEAAEAMLNNGAVEREVVQVCAVALAWLEDIECRLKGKGRREAVSERLTEAELQEEFSEVQAAVNVGARDPDDPYWRLLLTAREMLFANVALLPRVQEVEATLAGLADVLNQELRENSGDRYQTDPTRDMREAVRRLVDCVRGVDQRERNQTANDYQSLIKEALQTEEERDALQDEAVRLRETLDEALAEATKGTISATQEVCRILGEALPSTPASARAAERTRMLEGVADAAKTLLYHMARRDDGINLVGDPWVSPLSDALAALDNAGEGADEVSG